MIKSVFFVFRIALAWLLAILLFAGLWSELPLLGRVEWPVVVLGMATMALVVAGAIAHIGRVRLLAGHVDRATLANRQRRQIEIPLEAGQAFDLLEAAIRELPGIRHVEAARDSLQLRASVERPDAHGDGRSGRWNPLLWFGMARDQILATVTPGDDSGSVTLICEPDLPAWSDWFLVDDGSNHQNAEAISRAVTRRIAAGRRSEKAEAMQTATQKELAVARLGLLHAQVEPHFLYNTLASAQLLAASDPPRAERMLGHLIQYLRNSLPRTDAAQSTLGAELERALAYLEIMRIRMGPRLDVQVDVPDALRATPLPAMMVQTLVENAVKHGLEPRTAGGTVWIRARLHDGVPATVAVTVADDGEGLAAGAGSGTGIGLANVRERLRLGYGGQASLAVVANFPTGVAATLTVPVPLVEARSHG